MLSLDIGEKRVGIAGCDPLGITITALKCIHRTDFLEDVRKIKIHCVTRKVQGLVAGLPLDKDGGYTKQAKKCKAYGLKIAKSLNLPIAWVNEHSSTWAASEKYSLSKDRSGALDSACAVILLEQWLREGPDVEPVDSSTIEI